MNYAIDVKSSVLFTLLLLQTSLSSPSLRTKCIYTSVHIKKHGQTLHKCQQQKNHQGIVSPPHFLSLSPFPSNQNKI
ncbi:hypothetical protein PSV09DRAFT_2329920, partial [Bipolaris maydis]|uniref:uncharacterized protein n=1 Tax=Cochliobolus heterostrophus TaxID=5016 RepID=UPI0024D5A88A